MNRRRFLSFLGVAPIAAVGAVAAAPAQARLVPTSCYIDASGAGQAAIDSLRRALTQIANDAGPLSRQEAWRLIRAEIDGNKPFNKQIVLT